MIADHMDSIEDIRVRYLKNGLRKNDVLLLHGYSFSADTWKDLKTLEILEDNNIGAIALDFPGFGHSEKLKGLDYSSFPLTSEEAIKHSIHFLKLFIDKNFDTVTIIGPSMGAQLAINYIINYPSKVDRLILIGPVGFRQKSVRDNLKTLKNHVLIMRGEKDNICSEQDVLDLKGLLQNSQLIEYPSAGHPCYLNVPELFHRDILKFLVK